MTATEAPPLATIGALADLRRHRDAALAPDAPLDATIAYLRVLSNADEAALVEIHVADPATRSHMARVEIQMALSNLVHFLCAGVDPVVRAAPPSGLAEVVRDVLVECQAPTCGVMRAPWDSTCCHDAACIAEVQRVFGSV